MTIVERVCAALLGAALSALLLLTAGTAVASAASPSAVSPKRGKVFAPNATITLRVRDTSRTARRFGVFLTISNKKSFEKSGRERGDLVWSENLNDGFFTQMKRRASSFTYTVRGGTFTRRRGRYYWQAYHIDCGLPKGACHKHTKLGSFTIR